jgi:hypothetical protein
MALRERMKATYQPPLATFVPAHTHSWRRTTTAAHARTTLVVRRLEESLDAPKSTTRCERLRRGGCVQLTVQAN